MNYKYEEGIQSERLITRYLTPDDVPAWIEFLKDPECVKFIPNPEAIPPDDYAVYWILTQITSYKQKKYGFQVLLNKVTGELIGQAGLLMQEVDGQPELEVASHIMKQHWGKGYAAEAVKMFKDYGLKHGQAKSIIGLVHRDNIPAQIMAKRAGLEIDKETRWYDLDVFVFRASSL